MSNKWISISEERSEQFPDYFKKLIELEHNHALEEPAWTCSYIHIQSMVQYQRNNEVLLPHLISSFFPHPLTHSHFCNEHLYIKKKRDSD